MLVGERKEKRACFFDPIGPPPFDGAGNSYPSGTASRPLSPFCLFCASRDGREAPIPAVVDRVGGRAYGRPDGSCPPTSPFLDR